VNNSIKKALSACLVIISFSLAGCATTPPAIPDANLITVNYVAADKLLEGTDNAISTNQPILITSFVNINDLMASSSFGRITSEQVGSRISQSGYPVIELKLRNSIFIKEQSGEFILSRELKSLSTLHDAQAVLVGTYAEATNSVYVTAKLIHPSNGEVLASYDYVLPKGTDTKTLLKK
jgi:TolB-like protein